jgi:ADP-ribosylglycohydrolase
LSFTEYIIFQSSEDFPHVFQQVVHSHGYVDDPLKASEMVWERGNRQAAPNGALMRCSASAFVHYDNPEKVKTLYHLHIYFSI